MALPSPYSLPDLFYGSADADHRMSDADTYFRLVSPALNQIISIREPIGWDGAEWTLERDTQWHGINFEFTGEEAVLRFQQVEAIDFIELNYSRSGPNVTLFLEWGLTDNTGDLALQTLRLNLAKRSKKGGELTIPAERYSVHPDIRAGWDTVLSMDQKKSLINDSSNNPVAITPPAPSILVLHSQRIKKTTTIKPMPDFQDTDWVSFQNDGTSVLQGGSVGQSVGQFQAFRHFLLYFPLTVERASPAEVDTYLGNNLEVDTSLPQSSGHALLKIATDGEYTFSVVIDFQVDCRLQRAAISISPPKIDDYTLNCYLVVGNTKHVVGSQIAGSPGSRFMGVARYTASLTYTEKLPKNTDVYFYAELVINPSRANWRGTDVRLLVYSASINITANTYAPPSACPAYPVFDVLSHFMACLTGRQNAVQSSYYSFAGNDQPTDGGGSHRLITNGYYVRGFTGKPVQNSMQKFLSSLQAIDAIGLSYKPTDDGDVLVIEPIANFYRDNKMLSLSSYSVIEEETAGEYLNTGVEVGYSTFPDEGPQVLDEFNTKQQYALPMREGATYSAVSDLIASGYALEMTRRAQFSAQPNDSTTYDDNNFIVCASQLAQLTPEHSEVTVTAVFFMVAGKASLVFDLFYKPAWMAKGVTFLVSGTEHNDGVYKAIDYLDSYVGNKNQAVVTLDRQITEELVVATLSVSMDFAFQAERDESFESVTGVLDPETTYNLRLAPRFNLLRHAPYIAGGLIYSNGSEPIRCTYVKNNGTLRTKLADNAEGDLNIDSRKLIQHNDDLTVADLKYPIKPIWKPERIKISTKLSTGQMLFLRACLTGAHPDPTLHYGFIELTGSNGVIEGFPLSISFKRSTGEAILILLKKSLSLSQLQGQRGCSFYGAYVFNVFEASQPGAIDPWIEQCTFDNFQ
ncbi:hypothetical protein [Spirosoma aerolatum]|uniref:hypothetical protein n=1 Tax=Spirosoma aerolatum TaxID=1211326 RepID=UPI0012D36A32|nr:hypothetical protein [Spirosoma aerolatum]